MTLIEQILEIGIPLGKAVLAMVSEAILASHEAKEAILRRLTATAAALVASADEAHVAHTAELEKTLAVIAAETTRLTATASHDTAEQAQDAAATGAPSGVPRARQ